MSGASTPIARVEIRTGTHKTAPSPAIYRHDGLLRAAGLQARHVRQPDAGVSRRELHAALRRSAGDGAGNRGDRAALHLAVSLLLDPAVIASLLIDVPQAQLRTTGPGTTSPAFGIGALTPDLQAPLLRLLRLLDTPADIRVLAPLAERELLYRLLQGPAQGRCSTASFTVAGSRLSQVRRAIEWIRGRHVTRLARGTRSPPTPG